MNIGHVEYGVGNSIGSIQIIVHVWMVYRHRKKPTHEDWFVQTLWPHDLFYSKEMMYPQKPSKLHD